MGNYMIIEKETYDKMPKELQKFFNVIRDEVMKEFDKAGILKTGAVKQETNNGAHQPINLGGGMLKKSEGSEGSAARFFYCSKASGKEKNEGTTGSGNTHATVKPIKLMTYLINMITPPNGIVLDPFLGSGSTGVAAVSNGFNFIGIEKEEEYMKIARARIEYKNNEIKK